MCSGTRAPRLQLKERGGACAGAGRGGGHPARAGSPGFWNIDGSGRPGGRRPGFVLLPRPLSGAAGPLSLEMPTGAGRPGGGSGLAVWSERFQGAFPEAALKDLALCSQAPCPWRNARACSLACLYRVRKESLSLGLGT